MNHKYQNPSTAIKAIYGRDKDRLRLRGGGGGGGGGVLCFMLTLMILIPSFCVSADGKAIQQNKKSLKLFKSSSSSASLIESRHKRDTFANERQPQQSTFVRDTNVYQEQIGAEDDYDYYENDDNYDVIPDMKTADGGYPPTVEDQISEKAKEVAESFTQMWQSLTDSIRHCLNAVRRLFDDDNEEYDGEAGTEEQEEELRIAMEEYYRVKNMHDNEVLMNA